MKLEKVLKLVPILYCIVTTIFFFILGVQSVLFFPGIILNGRDILNGMLLTFLSLLPVFILVYKENASRLERFLRHTIHFLLSGSIVFGFLIYFGYLIVETAAFAIAVFIFMYVAGYAIMEIRDRKLAAKLNERINMLQNDDAQ